MKKLRILLVEDDPASIESAKKQFRGHTVKVLKTCMEIIDMSHLGVHDIDEYDLILTDVNIPMGNKVTSGYSVFQHHEGRSMWSAGLVVAMIAIQYRKPCAIVTDSNGHEDVLGLILENSLGGIVDPTVSKPSLDDNMWVNICTRPEWIDTKFGKGKDWIQGMGWKIGVQVGLLEPERQ